MLAFYFGTIAPPRLFQRYFYSPVIHLKSSSTSVPPYCERVVTYLFDASQGVYGNDVMKSVNNKDGLIRAERYGYLLLISDEIYSYSSTDVCAFVINILYTYPDSTWRIGAIDRYVYQWCYSCFGLITHGNLSNGHQCQLLAVYAHCGLICSLYTIEGRLIQQSVYIVSPEWRSDQTVFPPTR